MSDTVTIYTKNGAVQVTPLARWTRTVGSADYDFVLHVIPQEGVYNQMLGISEVSTGASMQAELIHPNGSGKIMEEHTRKGRRGYLKPEQLERLGLQSLKKQLSHVTAERFEAMVGFNLMARSQREQAELQQRNQEKVREEKIAEEEFPEPDADEEGEQ